jgi:hypothetical protein
LVLDDLNVGAEARLPVRVIDIEVPANGGMSSQVAGTGTVKSLADIFEAGDSEADVDEPGGA